DATVTGVQTCALPIFVKNLIGKTTNERNVTGPWGVFKFTEIEVADNLLQFGSVIASSQQACYNRTSRGASKIGKFVSCCLDHRSCSYEADSCYPATLKHPIDFLLVLCHVDSSF